MYSLGNIQEKEDCESAQRYPFVVAHILNIPLYLNPYHFPSIFRALVISLPCGFCSFSLQADHASSELLAVQSQLSKADGRNNTLEKQVCLSVHMCICRAKKICIVSTNVCVIVFSPYR